MPRARLRTVGEHAMIALCPWTAHSISRNRPCYKQQFYGIPSHRCVQMSPWSLSCGHNCLHCWRPPCGSNKAQEILPPEPLANAIVREHLALVAGFEGSNVSDLTRAHEAKNPSNVAMSLTGEASRYPYLDELIEIFKCKGFSTILVTAGAEERSFANLVHLPSMLYLSVLAYDEKSYERLCRPIESTWKDWVAFCAVFSQLHTTRVLRVTLIKGLNDHDRAMDGFSKIVGICRPKFIEVRSYAPVGRAALIGRENILPFENIVEFCQEFCHSIDYRIAGINMNSGVLLLNRANRVSPGR